MVSVSLLGQRLESGVSVVWAGLALHGNNCMNWSLGSWAFFDFEIFSFSAEK